jgi:hypothetical protein
MKPLSKLQLWMLRKIFSTAMVQGAHHANNLVTIQSLLLEVLRKEFYEDNDVTLDYFVRDCYLDAKANVIPAAVRPSFGIGV